MDLRNFFEKRKRDQALTVRLPNELVEIIKSIATKYSVSQSEVIEASINFLNKELSSKSRVSSNSQKIYVDKSLIKFIDISNSDDYQIPAPENKIISLFSGAGGLDLGLEYSGFETSVCVEIDEHCRETLRYNRPNWKLVEGDKGGKRQPGDIRDIKVSEILKLANLEAGEAALVVGGAPCQPFSNIGKKTGKECPKNGDLFLEFVRVIKGTNPKGFIFENVSGITQGKHSSVLEYMKSSLSHLGYSVSTKVLSAADYGVPQKRERFILIGIKGNSMPAFPLQTHFKNKEQFQKAKNFFKESPPLSYKKWETVGQAFSQLPNNYSKREDYCIMNISDAVKERMKRIGPNENFKVLPDKMLPNCWKSGRHQGADTFGRMDINDVSNTIRTAAYNPSKGKYIHPTEHRGLNSIEMSLIQSFPIDWQFKMNGRSKITLKSAGMQIGNAVPPVLAKAIGDTLKKQLFF